MKYAFRICVSLIESIYILMAIWGDTGLITKITATSLLVLTEMLVTMYYIAARLKEEDSE